MSIDTWLAFLGWSAVVNMSLLLLWFVAIVAMPDFIYRVQGRWFGLSREHFNAIHYALLGVFKMGIWLLNLTPYLVLRAIA